MNQRQTYLKEKWRPYPAAPVPISEWSCGEIAEITPEKGLILQSQGRLRQVPGTLAWFSDAREVSALSILAVGDKVAVRNISDGLEVMLLAPCLKEQRPLPMNFSVAEKWQIFVGLVRQHWTEQGFVEIQTPSIVPCPGFEPTLKPISVGQHGYLPTSPEIHLKKALAAGWSEIFEIRSCFRDGEFSQHHQPEFTLLEWYRSYRDLPTLEYDLTELLARLERSGMVMGRLDEFERYTVAELFEGVVELYLTSKTTREELAKHCGRLQIPVAVDDSWSDLFHRIWVDRIDPWLANRESPVLVHSFPSQQAALARISSEGWAERMELYWRGLEIANGFHELNDPQLQRERGERDLQEAARLGRPKIAMDEDFIAALERGMAPGVGMALGMERLFMATQGIGDIRQLKAFPYHE